MEMSQGNSLYSYLIQAKMSLFLEKWRTRRQNRSCLKVGTVVVGRYKERVQEGEYGTNNVYTCM
jgi:hypothetical protein